MLSTSCTNVGVRLSFQASPSSSGERVPLARIVRTSGDLLLRFRDFRLSLPFNKSLLSNEVPEEGLCLVVGPHHSIEKISATYYVEAQHSREVCEKLDKTEEIIPESSHPSKALSVDLNELPELYCGSLSRSRFSVNPKNGVNTNCDQPLRKSFKEWKRLRATTVAPLETGPTQEPLKEEQEDDLLELSLDFDSRSESESQEGQNKLTNTEGNSELIHYSTEKEVKRDGPEIFSSVKKKPLEEDSFSQSQAPKRVLRLGLFSSAAVKEDLDQEDPQEKSKQTQINLASLFSRSTAPKSKEESKELVPSAEVHAAAPNMTKKNVSSSSLLSRLSNNSSEISLFMEDDESCQPGELGSPSVQECSEGLKRNSPTSSYFILSFFSVLERIIEVEQNRNENASCCAAASEMMVQLGSLRIIFSVRATAERTAVPRWFWSDEETAMWFASPFSEEAQVDAGAFLAPQCLVVRRSALFKLTQPQSSPDIVKEEARHPLCDWGVMGTYLPRFLQSINADCASLPTMSLVPLPQSLETWAGVVCGLKSSPTVASLAEPQLVSFPSSRGNEGFCNWWLNKLCGDDKRGEWLELWPAIKGAIPVSWKDPFPLRVLCFHQDVGVVRVLYNLLYQLWSRSRVIFSNHIALDSDISQSEGVQTSSECCSVWVVPSRKSIQGPFLASDSVGMPCDGAWHVVDGIWATSSCVMIESSIVECWLKECAGEASNRSCRVLSLEASRIVESLQAAFFYGRIFNRIHSQSSRHPFSRCACEGWAREVRLRALASVVALECLRVIPVKTGVIFFTDIHGLLEDWMRNAKTRTKEEYCSTVRQLHRDIANEVQECALYLIGEPLVRTLLRCCTVRVRAKERDFSLFSVDGLKKSWLSPETLSAEETVQKVDHEKVMDALLDAWVSFLDSEDGPLKTNAYDPSEGKELVKQTLSRHDPLCRDYDYFYGWSFPRIPILRCLVPPSSFSYRLERLYLSPVILTRFLCNRQPFPSPDSSGVLASLLFTQNSLISEGTGSSVPNEWLDGTSCFSLTARSGTADESGIYRLTCSGRSQKTQERLLDHWRGKTYGAEIQVRITGADSTGAPLPLLPPLPSLKAKSKISLAASYRLPAVTRYLDYPLVSVQGHLRWPSTYQEQQLEEEGKQPSLGFVAPALLVMLRLVVDPEQSRSLSSVLIQLIERIKQCGSLEAAVQSGLTSINEVGLLDFFSGKGVQLSIDQVTPFTLSPLTWEPTLTRKSSFTARLAVSLGGEKRGMTQPLTPRWFVNKGHVESTGGGSMHSDDKASCIAQLRDGLDAQKKWVRLTLLEPGETGGCEEENSLLSAERLKDGSTTHPSSVAALEKASKKAKTVFKRSENSIFSSTPLTPGALRWILTWLTDAQAWETSMGRGGDTVVHSDMSSYFSEGEPATPVDMHNSFADLRAAGGESLRVTPPERKRSKRAKKNAHDWIQRGFLALSQADADSASAGKTSSTNNPLQPVTQNKDSRSEFQLPLLLPGVGAGGEVDSSAASLHALLGVGEGIAWAPPVSSVGEESLWTETFRSSVEYAAQDWLDSLLRELYPSSPEGEVPLSSWIVQVLQMLLAQLLGREVVDYFLQTLLLHHTGGGAGCLHGALKDESSTSARESLLALLHDTEAQLSEDVRKGATTVFNGSSHRASVLKACEKNAFVGTGAPGGADSRNSIGCESLWVALQRGVEKTRIGLHPFLAAGYRALLNQLLLEASRSVIVRRSHGCSTSEESGKVLQVRDACGSAFSTVFSRLNKKNGPGLLTGLSKAASVCLADQTLKFWGVLLSPLHVRECAERSVDRCAHVTAVYHTLRVAGLVGSPSGNTAERGEFFFREMLIEKQAHRERSQWLWNSLLYSNVQLIWERASAREESPGSIPLQRGKRAREKSNADEIGDKRLTYPRSDKSDILPFLTAFEQSIMAEVFGF